MKKLFFVVFMCLSLCVSAVDVFDTDVAMVNVSASLDVDCMSGGCYEPVINTEIADSTTRTGENTQTRDNAAPTNEGFDGFSTDTMAYSLPQEHGWRS